MTHTELSKLIRCEKCGAAPGETCRTRSGRRATWPHSVRSDAANAVWIAGLLEGTREWVSEIVRVAETGNGWASLVHNARVEKRWVDSETNR